MQKKNIVWLASYPKSGNTWFRAFLTALLDEPEELNLNELTHNLIYSGRQLIEAYTDIDSTYLYDEEVKLLLPEVYRQFSNDIDVCKYIKVHDAFILNKEQQPIIPPDCSRCAIYFIRNPLDIVASFSNHLGRSIDATIDLMNNPEACLSRQKNNLNTLPQTRQLLGTWSNHVNSWTNQTSVPVLTLRYEDMLQDPLDHFKKAVHFLGLHHSDEEILQAINATSFSALQSKEKAKGFREKLPGAKAFFRSGTSGNWKTELSPAQAKLITDNHYEVMQQFGYTL